MAVNRKERQNRGTNKRKSKRKLRETAAGVKE